MTKYLLVTANHLVVILFIQIESLQNLRITTREKMRHSWDFLRNNFNIDLGMRIKGVEEEEKEMRVSYW